MSELQLPDNFIRQDIKPDPLTPKQIEEMYSLAGSYESLFSKRAKLYKERDLKNQRLEDENYRDLILEHYTFLKRPVIINESSIFIGNSKMEVEGAKQSIHG